MLVAPSVLNLVERHIVDSQISHGRENVAQPLKFSAVCSSVTCIFQTLSFFLCTLAIEVGLLSSRFY